MIRIVDRNTDASGWALRAALNADPLAIRETKKLAVAQAVQEFQASGEGGELSIYLADGRLERTRNFIPRIGPAKVPVQGGGGLISTVEKEGEHWDTGIDWLLALLGLPGAAALAASISPEVLDAAESGWIGVFFATLTWSLGCGLAVLVHRKSSLNGWPEAAAIGLCFVGALAIANGIGAGVLDISSSELAKSSNPLEFVGVFVVVAVETYGPIGALLSGGIGVWLGYRVADHV